MNAKSTFSKKHLEYLKQEYSKFDKVSTDALPRFHAVLGAMSKEQINQIIDAKIKWLAPLGRNELIRREQKEREAKSDLQKTIVLQKKKNN